MKKLFFLSTMMIGCAIAQEGIPGRCGKSEDDDIRKEIYLSIVKPERICANSLNRTLPSEWLLDFSVSDDVMLISSISGCKDRNFYFNGDLPPIPAVWPAHLFFKKNNKLKEPGSLITLCTKAGQKVLFKMWYDENINRNN